MLRDGLAAEELSLIRGGYFRAVELLFDADYSVRCSAVHAVGELGRLSVMLNQENSIRDWSDALFVQLCLMVRDMDMRIRVESFCELGKIETVSKDILLQTLSKKLVPGNKGKSYPGQYTANLYKLPATAAAYAFVHGLEDEFHEVRKATCHAIQKLTHLSGEFAAGAVSLLMDLLNDDSVEVRLQALETSYQAALLNHLKIEESHLEMLCAKLVDNNISVRSGVRKFLRITKLRNLAMFKTCINSFLENLELYPLDEADAFNSMYKIGRSHGKFVTSLIEENSQQLEPCFDGNLGFSNIRTAALLLLAISAPVSFEQKSSSIPPQFFSYAVTLLDRISNSLVDIMDQHTILAYLIHCSKFTYPPDSKNFEEEDLNSLLEGRCLRSCVRSNETSVDSHEMVESERRTAKLCNDLLNFQTGPASSSEAILQKVNYLWPLIKHGILDNVLQTLRSWKEEVRNSADGSSKSAAVVFALNFLGVVELLGKAYVWHFSPRNLQQFKQAGILSALSTTETILEEMLNRYTELGANLNLYLLELMLLTHVLRGSHGGTGTYFTFNDYINKMTSLLQLAEHLSQEDSIRLPEFVIELHNITKMDSEDLGIDMILLYQKSLSLFSLRPIVLPEEVRYLIAEIDAGGNDFNDPIPFVSGLPVGIPLDIRLYNIPRETRLWIKTSVGGNGQFIFLDLDEFEGCREFRKCSFVAPFYDAPFVKHFSLKVSVAMEVAREIHPLKKMSCSGHKSKLVYLCEEKEVYLSTRREFC